METFDIVVIGAGPGGYPAAIRAAQLGKSVAIVERDRTGGTCLNWGCIPTKSLIAVSSLYAGVAHAAAMGITARDVSINFAAAMEHKRRTVDQLRGGVDQLLQANGVKVFAGTASFKDRNKLAVLPADGSSAPVELQAGKVIIATGSTSVMPGFLPKNDRVMDSKAFLDMAQLPSRLLVLGGGYIGCELACMAAQLGSKVTVVELLEDILVQLDPDLRKEVRAHMQEQLGIRILTGKPLEDVKADDKGVQGKVGGETIEADALLVSVGRKPVTDGLGLDKAGLKTNERGFIPVDKYCRTAVASIYAVGDVNGGIQLAHAATSQGIAAAENAAGPSAGTPSETLVPAVIYTAPEVATVGLTEKAAGEAGRNVRVGKFPFRALGRAIAAGHPNGFVKWICDPETDQLLGAAAVGPHATDLIAEATVAVRNELTVEEIGRTIHAHPTFSEIWMEAAHAVHGVAIHAAPKKRAKQA